MTDSSLACGDSVSSSQRTLSWRTFSALHNPVHILTLHLTHIAVDSSRANYCPPTPKSNRAAITTRIGPGARSTPAGTSRARQRCKSSRTSLRSTDCRLLRLRTAGWSTIVRSCPRTTVSSSVRLVLSSWRLRSRAGKSSSWAVHCM